MRLAETKEPLLLSQTNALGDALIIIGQEYPKTVVLSPDVGTSTKAIKFKEHFNDRYFCTGISEMNTIGLAAGLSQIDWIPMVIGYAMFVAGKGWEPFRNCIVYPHFNVKLIGTHGGINVGPDGVTHQAIEDIAIMRAIPDMTILVPADANQVLPALRAAISIEGPVYIRLERDAIPATTNANQSIEIGKAYEVRKGKDATIMAIGSMLWQSLCAADHLVQEGIDAGVINMVSVKPIDIEAISKAARETGAIVTVEDHNIIGGLGSAVAEVIVGSIPVPVEMVAIQDKFAESGNAAELREKYRLTCGDIIRAVKRVMNRKGGKNNT
jgi:transketolase